MQFQKNITKPINDEGNVHTKKDQILNHIAEFYTKLYTEEPTDARAQLKAFGQHSPTYAC